VRQRRARWKRHLAEESGLGLERFSARTYLQRIADQRPREEPLEHDRGVERKGALDGVDGDAVERRVRATVRDGIANSLRAA
jgi:hypothetical protein